MKRYLILLIIVLAIASGAISCNQKAEEESLWTEKQTIEYVHNYLMDKAAQLHNKYHARAEQMIINLKFEAAVINAESVMVHEYDIDKWGEQIQMDFTDPVEMEIPHVEMFVETHAFVHEGALKELAHYQGDGSWLVSIGDWIWQVNENSGEVIAQSEAAIKWLESLNYQSYHSTTYNYRIDYPSSWSLMETGEDVLIVATEPQVDIAILEPQKLQPEQSLGECASGFATFFSTVHEDFELISLDRLANGDYQLDYKWIIGGTIVHSRTYFALRSGWVYMISGSAPESVYESYADEFTLAYGSFRLE